jgi:hypothetical protein
VTLRNEFARVPGVALRVLESIARELSAITADPRGADAKVVLGTTFQGTGPRYWS